MAALLTVALTVNFFFAYISIIYIVPSSERSRFRYRLWKLRDRVVDEIYDGRFENVEQPKRLVALIELAIYSAEEISWLKVMAARLVKKPPRGLPMRLLVDLRAVSAHDRDLLRPRLNVLYWCVARHVFLGTPSGWLACLRRPFLTFHMLKFDDERLLPPYDPPAESARDEETPPDAAAPVPSSNGHETPTHLDLDQFFGMAAMRIWKRRRKPIERLV
jgi:hypothetical protein